MTRKFNWHEALAQKFQEIEDSLADARKDRDFYRDRMVEAESGFYSESLITVLVERLKEDIDGHRESKWEPNGWDAGAAFCIARLRAYGAGGPDCHRDAERGSADVGHLHED